MYFYRTGHFHEELAALIQPDVLITENVERYLDTPLADEARPHFLLYPILQGQSYAPAKEFAEAFSAVLSYPRSPYWDFLKTLPHRPSSRQTVRIALRRFEINGCVAWQRVACHFGSAGTGAAAAAALVADFSGRGLAPKQHKDQQIHGSYLVRRENVLLFGANHLVDGDGAWSCEARSFKGQFMAMLKWAAYEANFPGPKPVIDDFVLRTAGLKDDQVERIEMPVFLATPLEPDNWGRWLATVAPKAVLYRMHGIGRKFLCRVKTTVATRLPKPVGYQ